MLLLEALSVPLCRLLLWVLRLLQRLPRLQRQLLLEALSVPQPWTLLLWLL